MKKFAFPLDRVLAWRQTQTRLEEATLARLNAEVQALDLRCSTLDQSVRQAGARLLAAPSATPTEIGAMEYFRTSASAQVRSLIHARRTLEQKLAQQTQAVLERRRDAQLLEQLRERRWNLWKAATDREIEQQADEAFLAKFWRSLPPMR